MPKEGMERRAYRSRTFGWERSQRLDAEVAAVGAQEGLSFRHDLMARTPNTFDAHRLIWLADHEGRQDAIVEALFRAYFTEGRDIGDRAVLVELAAEAGIDPARTRVFIEGEEGAADVSHEEATAHAQRVSGVPAFVVDGRELFSGAQRAELMASQLRAAAERRADG